MWDVRYDIRFIARLTIQSNLTIQFWCLETRKKLQLLCLLYSSILIILMFAQMNMKLFYWPVPLCHSYQMKMLYDVKLCENFYVWHRDKCLYFCAELRTTTCHLDRNVKQSTTTHKYAESGKFSDLRVCPAIPLARMWHTRMKSHIFRAQNKTNIYLVLFCFVLVASFVCVNRCRIVRYNYFNYQLCALFLSWTI